jgi:hypothetical protein
MTAIFAVGAVQAAHAFQYGFSAILWKAQGISEAVTGQLWAFGVVVEIALMWLVEPWRRRAGSVPGPCWWSARRRPSCAGAPWPSPRRCGCCGPCRRCTP